MARTESTLTGSRSSVYGESTFRVVEAVPPTISRLRLSPLDATTTELLLEHEVLGTAGRMHYAVLEVQAATMSGKVTYRKDQRPPLNQRLSDNLVIIVVLEISKSGADRENRASSHMSSVANSHRFRTARQSPPKW